MMFLLEDGHHGLGRIVQYVHTLNIYGLRPHYFLQLYSKWRIYDNRVIIAYSYPILWYLSKKVIWPHLYTFENHSAITIIVPQSIQLVIVNLFVQYSLLN